MAFILKGKLAVFFSIALHFVFEKCAKNFVFPNSFLGDSFVEAETN